MSKKQVKDKTEMTMDEAVAGVWLGDDKRIKKIGVSLTMSLPDGRFVDFEIRRTNYGKDENPPFDFFALVSETRTIKTPGGRVLPTSRVVYKETFGSLAEAKARLEPKIFNYLENGSFT